MEGKKKSFQGKRGGKLRRSEMVTIRLDPRLRYLTELAARKQRRTVSSFIEWAIELSLSQIMLEGNFSNRMPLAEAAKLLWDVDKPDRIVKLAFNFPELLTHEEQVLWKLIRECGALWEGEYDSQGHWRWDVKQESFIFQQLREHWEKFELVAAGEANKSFLPPTPKYEED